MAEWISVKHGTPKRGVYVLAYRPDAVFDKYKILRFSSDFFEGVEVVTHWMPLPEPPKVTE